MRNYHPRPVLAAAAGGRRRGGEGEKAGWYQTAGAGAGDVKYRSVTDARGGGRGGGSILWRGGQMSGHSLPSAGAGRGDAGLVYCVDT